MHGGSKRRHLLLHAIKMIKIQNEKGYIAFITVLIIAALVLGVIISLPLITTDNLRSSLALKKGIETKELANSCAEIALIEIQKDINYEGESLSLEPGSCIISVADIDSGKEINIEATVEEYIKTLDIQVELLGKSINITSWEIS